jgi:prevent-host-death family protein
MIWDQRRQTEMSEGTTKRLSRSRGSRSGKESRPAQDNQPWTVQATHAKNRFGEILERVRNLGPVFIAKHGKAQAVVLNIDSYNTLVRKGRGQHEEHLDTLRAEFNALYADMQGRQSRDAVSRLLSASAETLNKVSAKRAKKRG